AGMPATVYVALYTTEPSSGGGGTEPSSFDGYDRVQVDNDSDAWPNASSGIKANGELITFPTASSAWGTVQWVALLDEGDNILVWGSLASPVSPSAGNTPFFEAGDLTV